MPHQEMKVLKASDGHAVRPDTGAPRTEAAAIADFTLGLDLSSVPPAVIMLAQEHFLDVVGIALASSTFDFGRAVLKAAQSMGAGEFAYRHGRSSKRWVAGRSDGHEAACSYPVKDHALDRHLLRTDREVDLAALISEARCGGI